jgi:6-phosphofructo-2-kinase/fructose-2,6-biphosphatase 4
MEGGRKQLSDAGHLYAKKAKQQIMEDIRSPEGLNFGIVDQPIAIWTSTNTRSKDVASYFSSHGTIIEINSLVDMNPGVVDNMTPEQIQEKYPQEFEEHKADGYNYRFPRAEVLENLYDHSSHHSQKSN